jgi:hypothetical protein
VKIKLDENLPADLQELLRTAKHDVASVAEQGLAGCDDPSVLQAAAAEGRIFMTFDTDFADIRTYPPGTHAGRVPGPRLPQPANHWRHPGQHPHLRA